MPYLMPVPYIESEEGHFPSLTRANTPLDRRTYISDEALKNLQECMQEWTARVISGKAPYASPGEIPLSRKNVS